MFIENARVSGITVERHICNTETNQREPLTLYVIYE